MRERFLFDPESLRTALDRNLVDGLRALADALDAKELDGRCLQVHGHGFTDARDTRLHLIVSLDVAAEMYVWKGGAKHLLPEPPMLSLSTERDSATDGGTK